MMLAVVIVVVVLAVVVLVVSVGGHSCHEEYRKYDSTLIKLISIIIIYTGPAGDDVGRGDGGGGVGL